MRGRKEASAVFQRVRLSQGDRVVTSMSQAARVQGHDKTHSGISHSAIRKVLAGIGGGGLFDDVNTSQIIFIPVWSSTAGSHGSCGV